MWGNNRQTGNRGDPPGNPGFVCAEGDHWYIVYKEYDEDNPNRYQTSILKVEKNDKVTLMRGNSSTRLILEKGKRHLCQYDTGMAP